MNNDGNDKIGCQETARLSSDIRVNKIHKMTSQAVSGGQTS